MSQIHELFCWHVVCFKFLNYFKMQKGSIVGVKHFSIKKFLYSDTDIFESWFQMRLMLLKINDFIMLGK